MPYINFYLDYFAQLVQGVRKLMTCGSDFHGKTKPLIEIGQFKFKEKYVPYLEKSIQQIRSCQE